MFKCHFLPKVPVRTCYLSQYILKLGHSRWPICKCDPMISPSVHSRSYEATFFFLPLTLDSIEIWYWEWSQSVTFAKKHGLMCHMWYLARVTLTWGQFLILTLKVNMYIFRRISTRGARCCQIVSLLIQFFELKTFRQKKRYFDFSWPL